MKPEKSYANRVITSILMRMGGLEHAFLYGSGPAINLLLVGDLEHHDVARAILDIEKATGRQVNYLISTGRDLQERLLKGDPFIGAVMQVHRRIYGPALVKREMPKPAIPSL